MVKTDEIEDAVRASVIHVLKRKLPLETNISTALTGGEWGLSDIDMVYLFMELTRLYPTLKWEKEDFDNYGFNSIKKIAATIKKKLDL